MAVERMCAVCRQKREKSELLRIAKNADGRIELDNGVGRSGRGMYICRDGDCIKNAEKRRAVERSFKTSGDEVKKIYAELAEFDPNA
ncbi:MAG: YlxR family protein [Clostridiales bacterium]|jgi:predicted RNA-binding protein YlxR (DUF448 family)|nr:YlxR family protein [Clostridiales bacterium]